MLPETDAFIERQENRAASGNISKTFMKEGKVALKRHWLLLTYLVLLMAGFNFMVCCYNGLIRHNGVLISPF